MLTLLHAGMSQSGEPSEFAYRLRRARLLELIDNPSLSRWFAHTYAGVDP